MKLRNIVALGAAGLFMTSSAMALEAKFTLEQQLAGYVMTTLTPDTGDKTTASVFATTGAPLLTTVSLNKFNIFFYPTAPNSVGASYMITPSLELGGELGLNSQTTETGTAKTENSSHSVNVYGTYYLELGRGSLELTPMLTLAKEESDNGTTTTKSNKTDLGFRVSYVHSIIKDKLSWLGGALLTTGSESESKQKTMGISLNLSSLRFMF